MAMEKRKRGSGPAKSGNYVLSEQARLSLEAHAAAWGISKSVILDYLCCTHLRAVKIVRWSEAPPAAAEPDPAAEAGGTAATLPIGEVETPALGSSQGAMPGQGRGQARGRRVAG